jgi:hypothetical protein
MVKGGSSEAFMAGAEREKEVGGGGAVSCGATRREKGLCRR